MAAYSFRGTWTIPAPPSRVRSVLVDLEHYPDWWPQVRSVTRVDDDTAHVLCRSRLPYTLDLVLHAVHRRPRLLETRVTGDLDGSVSWRLAAVDGGTRLDFEQDVVVEGVLGAASAVARPLLRWNHHQMMAGCIAGLRRRVG